jgi:SAM-dependent methyltransferase
MFKQNFQKKAELLADNRFACVLEDIWPCLNDRTANTGFDYHYTYHPAWASRALAKTMPKKHIDISSSIGFITCVSSFIPVEFYDYRPAQLNLSNLKTGFADVTKLPFDDDSIESLSCMHVVEHIGLERYGDPFDPQGDMKAITELQRVLMPGGNLLFVVPVGGQMRIQYNAHRIYTYESIINYFVELKLLQFALITDNGEYLENSDGNTASKQNYGCGCFWFTKGRQIQCY